MVGVKQEGGSKIHYSLNGDRLAIEDLAAIASNERDASRHAIAEPTIRAYYASEDTTLTKTDLSDRSGLWSFEGRIGRLDYLKVQFVTFLPGLLLNFARASGEPLIIVASYLILLPVLVVGLASSVKRCHDLGVSGWFLLLGSLGALNSWFSFVFWLVLMIAKGHDGANKYGSSAKPLVW